MRGSELDVALRPSRLRWLTGRAACLLAVLIGPLQALRLEAAWPLLLLPATALLLWRLPECEPVRLRLSGRRIEARTLRGAGSGTLDPAVSITSFALELPVRWEDGRRERVVVWRDAVADEDYRRLARMLRQLPADPASGADPR